jgi:hypothetical protein
VKTYWTLIVLGIILFIVSFFLTAVKDVNAAPGASGEKGYFCAYITLSIPLGHDGWQMLRETPVNYFAVLLSGLINPVFVITVVLSLLKPQGRPGAILRIVLLFMFAACWIVFYRAHLRPQAGYFLWTAAMLLVLFSNKPRRAIA